jgi:NTP pyrophosphatase (non-canonical NTP hydrolase)
MSELSGGDLPNSPERVLANNAELPEIERFFNELYGKRDSIYLPGREIRAQLLYRGIDDLQSAVRQRAWLPIYEVMCARIVSRILCIARGADDVSIGEGLARKYPLEGCAYCGQMPCVCQENRDPYRLSAPTTEQEHWSLRDWQDHLTRMYGRKNKERGINYTLLRLGSEYGELISLERAIHRYSIDEVKDKYALELADAMAWTIAPAVLLGVDLQKAVEKRYGNGCLACHQIPCICPPHSFDQISRDDYGHIMEASFHS